MTAEKEENWKNLTEHLPSHTYILKQATCTDRAAI